MAGARLGQEPMKVDLPSGSISTPELPPISAIFLIYFDAKAGYTISWKRSLPGIELEGAVEYKSLPSGLHMVKNDLVYFIHETYAGLSAFANSPASDESRNARMIAVGILLPLSYGRLGRSWKHADKLIDMAQKLVLKPDETKVLEAFWESHKADENRKSEYADIIVESPSSTRFQPIMQQPGWTKGHGRTRSASDGTILLQSAYNVSSYHPVWSLSRLLDLFGPLIFPVYRAALLRRRILMSGHAPVRETCDFVYDISVLSNIPVAINDLLAPSAPPQRLRPLFSIGVHDVPFLEDDVRTSTTLHTLHTATDGDPNESDGGHGWIACTTDDILTMKVKLYDFLITLPPSYSAEARNKIWPKVESPRGTQIKATQRDFRRYRALNWGLSRTASESKRPATSTGYIAENGDYPTNPSTSHRTPLLDTTDTDSIIEPLSWSALAYSGFIWWASAGEQRRLEATDDSENDNILLDGFSLADPTMQTTYPTRSLAKSSLSQILPTPINTTEPSTDSTTATTLPQDQSAKREMSIIAYFHRLTALILTTLSDIIDATSSSDASDDDSNDDEGDVTVDTALRDGQAVDASVDSDAEPIVYISTSDIIKMGLDEWSSNDAAFVVEICQAYFGRTAEVEGMNVDICGIRIC